MVGWAGQARHRVHVVVVGQVALNAALVSVERMILWTNALHQIMVVNLPLRARSTRVRCAVVVLVIWADGAVLPIKVGIRCWAVLALPYEYIVDLLEGA